MWADYNIPEEIKIDETTLKRMAKQFQENDMDMKGRNVKFATIMNQTVCLETSKHCITVKCNGSKYSTRKNYTNSFKE